jgi:hypothetical protein
MRGVLRQHGSAALKESLSRPDADAVIDAYRDCTNLNEAIDRLAGRVATQLDVAP